MSEFQPKFENDFELTKAEKNTGAERLKSAELDKAAEEAEAKRQTPEQAAKRVEKALEKQPLKQHRVEKHSDDAPLYTHFDFKAHSLRQTIKRTQKKLSKPERTFSKFIHNNTVETTSDIAGATIARPSGLLFGGIFSAVSSLVVLYICKHYGYEYNFLIGSACFVGGFALGILLEGFGKLARR